jgi:hypothetical protein
LELKKLKFPIFPISNFWQLKKLSPMGMEMQLYGTKQHCDIIIQFCIIKWPRAIWVQDLGDHKPP